MKTYDHERLLTESDGVWATVERREFLQTAALMGIKRRQAERCWRLLLREADARGQGARQAQA